MSTTHPGKESEGQCSHCQQQQYVGTDALGQYLSSHPQRVTYREDAK